MPFDDSFAADLSSDFGDPYIVTRRGAGTIFKGIAQPGTTTPLNIIASVQPASGRDLLRLPEGRRSVDTRKLYTATKLLTGGAGAANEADLVTIDGKLWEVQQVQTYPAHYECLVQEPA